MALRPVIITLSHTYAGRRIMSRRRCTATTNRGGRCTRKPVKDGVCLIHHRLANGQPAVVSKQNGNGNGHSEPSLKVLLSADIKWLVTSATPAEFSRVKQLREALA